MKKSILLVVILFLSACANTAKYKNSTDRHYVVVDVEITDVDKYDKFLALEVPILKNYDAFVSMDLRSEDQKKRYIVISFPDKESVGAFVKSDEFQKILPMNKASSSSKIFHGKLHK